MRRKLYIGRQSPFQISIHASVQDSTRKDAQKVTNDLIKLYYCKFLGLFDEIPSLLAKYLGVFILI